MSETKYERWLPTLGVPLPRGAQYRLLGTKDKWHTLCGRHACVVSNHAWWSQFEFRVPVAVDPVPAPKSLDTDLSWLLKKAERWAANQPDPDAARARIRQAKAAFVEAVLLAIAGE